MFKTILLPFCDDDSSITALEQACAIAERFGSHIDGMFVTRPPQVIEAEGIALAGAYIQEIKGEWKRREEDARERFERVINAHGFAHRSIGELGPGCSASWQSVEGQEGQIIGDLGRAYDLIVISRIEKRALIDWEVMCESAFFESGRPVLLTAPAPVSAMGQRIAIHWNGSTEAARTIALAMPLLESAQQVRVIHVQQGAVPGPSAEEIARHLARNGVTADSISLDAGSRSNGVALLDEAAAFEADMIIKGAYTHSRMRQLVFGGATRHVLSNATIPAFMAR